MDGKLKYRGLKSIIWNASYLIGGQGINTLARAVYAVALARILGPETYGIFNYGLSWYLVLLPITILGLDVLMSREVGRHRERGIEIICNTLSVRMIVTVLLTLASMIAACLLEPDPDITLLIGVLSLALFGRSLFVWSKSAFAAIESARHSFRLEALLRPAEIMVGLLVLLQGGGLIAIAVVHTLSWWVQGLWGLRLLKRLEPSIHLRFEPVVIREILKAAIPLGMTGLFVTWFVQGPIIMFRGLEGFVPALGQLTLMIQVFLMFSSIPLGIGNAALPILTRSLIRQDGKSDLFIDGMLRIIVFVGGLAGLFLLALGEPLVVLIFGTDYALAGRNLGYMVLILVPFSCAVTIARTSLAEGRYGAISRATFFSVLLFTGGFYPAVAHFGFPGILISMAAGQLLRLVLLVRLHIQNYPLDVSTALLRPFALLAIAVLSVELLRPHSPYLAFASAAGLMCTGWVLAGIVRRAEIDLLSEHLFKRQS